MSTKGSYIRNPKKDGGQFDLPCGFSKKMYLLKGGWNPGFLIIISLIFPENFTEIPQVFQKTFSINIGYFHRFSSIF